MFCFYKELQRCIALIWLKLVLGDLVKKWPNRFLEQKIENNQLGRLLL
jgi:hypothetical protein